MSSKVVNLGDLTATGAGAAYGLWQEADQGRHATIFVQGTFVATTHVEISHDGINWIPAKADNNTSLAGLTIAYCALIRTLAPFIRARLSSFTSGTVSFRLVPL